MTQIELKASREFGRAKAKGREWLGNGWIPGGRCSWLFGDVGAGKSRLALQLAVAVAAGRPHWLGRHGLQVGAVGPAVLADFNDGREETARRLEDWPGMDDPKERYNALKGNLHHFDMARFLPLWTPSEGFNAAGGALLERCENLEAKLLIVDPAAAAFGGEKTDNYHCSRFALDLDGWARKSGCTVLVVDHPPTRKWDIDSVPSAFASLPRTVLSLQAWDRRATPGRPKQAGHLTLEKSNYSSLGGTRIRIETEEPKPGRDWSGWWTAQARYDG